jgi:hypothetical protein
LSVACCLLPVACCLHIYLATAPEIQQQGRPSLYYCIDCTLIQVPFTV